MIKIGDIVKLRPSVFAQEFQAREWSTKYLYEDPFEHVSLRFKKLGQPGDMARTIFGGSETVIEEIENDDHDQPFLVLTDSFRIVYPEALRKKEISVSSPSELTVKVCQAEKRLIEDLEFFEQKYLEGIFTVMERENNKLHYYKQGFYMMKREGRWHSAL